VTASRDTSCYDRALGLLARRPHFRRELQAKLNQRQYPAEEVESVLERLLAGGFVNDRATTQAFVEEKLRRGPVGRSRLAADLGRRGAPREIVDEVLAELLDEDDRAAAQEAARRWQRRRGGCGEERDAEKHRAALARYLERQGFSPRAVWGVLGELEAL
jgi:regulatory protein